MINSFPSDNTVFRKFPRILSRNSFIEYTVGLISRFRVFSASLRFDTTMPKSTLPTTIRSMSLCSVSLDRATEPYTKARLIFFRKGSSAMDRTSCIPTVFVTKLLISEKTRFS